MLNKCPNIVRSRIKKCPQLTQGQEDERLCWARIFMRCDWEKIRLLRFFEIISLSKSLFRIEIILSDKKKFNLDGSNVCHSYWRDLCKISDTFQLEISVEEVLWFEARSDLWDLLTTIISTDYQDICGHRLVPYFPVYAGVNFIFQRNNLIIYASRSTKTRLKNNKVDTMNWSSHSPDLNLMENLWAVLVYRIYADNRQFETTKDLQSAINSHVFRNLVNSVPERIFQVTNKSGSCTD
uniref:DDE_3 domain-containing protein n=1 Tax=Heterorhabditis bacteriophora TaxID=37862 RepID=A0A1I7XNV5_HETBA